MQAASVTMTLGPARPEAAVAHLGHGHDRLGGGEPDAGGDLGATGARAQMEDGDIRLRVLLVEDAMRRTWSAAVIGLSTSP